MGFLKRYIPNTYARVGVFVILLALLAFLGFGIFVRMYTREIIQNLIAYEAKGKAEVTIGEAKLRFFPQTRLDLLNTQIKFLDSTGKNATYEVGFTYLGMQLHSLRSFLLDRKLLVDFIVAEEPKIRIDQKYKEKKLKEGNDAVHFEIGNIFLAFKKIASSMQIKRFGLLNGNIILHNLAPNNTTINIGGVNFTAKELAMLPLETDLIQKPDAGRIRINTGKQDITLPEGNYRIQYSALHLDTEEKLISIDSFKITGKALDTSQNLIDAGFSKFKLYNFDFDALYVRNLIKIDSVVCVDPVIRLNLNTQHKETSVASQDLNTEKRLASLIGKLDLKYLGLLNSNITITTRDQKGQIPFHTAGNNFEAFDLKIDSSSKKPVSVGKLIFAIKNYKATSKDGMYDMLFDSVVYDNTSLTLKNFKIEPSDINNSKAKKYFFIPDFKLVNLSISELAAHKRLKADELLLDNAVFINDYLPRSKTTVSPQPLRNLIRSISDKIDINTIRIRNGYITNRSALRPDQVSIVGGLQSEISLNEIFDASTYELMGYSIGKVSFDSLMGRSGSVTMRLYQGEARGRDRQLTAKHLQIADSKSQAKINAENIRLKNYHFDDNFNDITIDSISYSSALIVGDPGREKTPAAPSANAAKRNITFRHISARNTDLSYVSGDSIKAETKINKLEISELVFDSSQNITLESLLIDGNGIAYTAPGLKARTGPYLVRDATLSSIQDMEFELTKKRDTVRATMNRLDFIPMINQSLKTKHPVIQELRFNEPVIFASLNNTSSATSENTNNGNKALEIGSLKILNGGLDIHQRKNGKSLDVRSKNVTLDVNEIRTNMDGEALHIGRSSLTTGMFAFALNDSIYLSIYEGNFHLALDHLTSNATQKKQVSFKLDTIRAEHLNLSAIGKKGKPFELKDFNVGGSDLTIDSLDKAHILNRLKENPNLYANNINLSKVGENTELYAYGIGYQNGGRVVTIDSFRFKPVLDRDSFNRTLKYQKDHIQVSSKKIRIRNFDIEKIATDSSYNIDYIEVDQPELLIYKDKRLPFETGIIKPLPVGMIGKIGPRIKIDSIRLRNGNLAYEEFNDKTNSIGKVYFTNMQVRLRNIDNHGHELNDSLKLGATARFLDTVNVGLRFHESYTDTLSAFLLQIRIGAFSLPAVNPVLRPLANARIDRGYLDTLELKAIGREYLALGKMRMLYRDLHVEMLNKADQEKRTLATKFITWVANLVVRRDNFKKTGVVFTERIREKSVFNYWIRMVLSGAMTNAGIKKNSKLEKKYKKSLKKTNVPEIPEVEL